MVTIPSKFPRIGCNFCFHTLDPNDQDVNKRTMVKCTACQRFYHATCWPGHCLKPDCNNASSQPIMINPPRPLDGKSRKAADFIGGGYPTLDDLPLGRSKDILFLNDTQPQEVRLKNNTTASLQLPRIFYLPWVTTYLEEHNRVLDGLPIEPKDELRILFQAEFVRPPIARIYIELHQGQGIELVTTQGLVPYYAGLGILALLVAKHCFDAWHLHLGLDIFSSVSASLSLGLVFGYLALIAPSWARNLWLRFFRAFDHMGEAVTFIDIEQFSEGAKRLLVVEENPSWVTSLLHRLRRASVTAVLAFFASLPMFALIALLGSSAAICFWFFYVAVLFRFLVRWADPYHFKPLNLAKVFWQWAMSKVQSYAN